MTPSRPTGASAVTDCTKGDIPAMPSPLTLWMSPFVANRQAAAVAVGASARLEASIRSAAAASPVPTSATAPAAAACPSASGDTS
jgi:hypothetical protein